jgi:hypothetical protein
MFHIELDQPLHIPQLDQHVPRHPVLARLVQVRQRRPQLRRVALAQAGLDQRVQLGAVALPSEDVDRFEGLPRSQVRVGSHGQVVDLLCPLGLALD